MPTRNPNNMEESKYKTRPREGIERKHVVPIFTPRINRKIDKISNKNNKGKELSNKFQISNQPNQPNQPNQLKQAC